MICSARTCQRFAAASISALLSVLLAACSGSPRAASGAQESDAAIMIGVSGPRTGPNAQYGAQWKKGFDLALQELNSKGGVAGRPLAYVFEDSQADPKQAVAIAQKFVSDPRIVIELGDFSSPASMAASAIYQRAGLVQFGFNNSHPDFTKGGDYMWSISISQADSQPLLADYAVAALELKRLAVLHLNTDWGRTSADLFARAATERGATIVATEAYLAEEKDFRSTLTRVRDAKPDGLILISYYADAALITQQARATGLATPIVAADSVYSPKFLELGGDAVDGVFLNTTFFPSDPRPEVQSFVRTFQATYNELPDSFAAGAYDTMMVVSRVIATYGVDRAAIRDGLAAIKDVPSVLYGTIAFGPDRRVADPHYTNLVVRDGAFVLWDGKKPIAAK